MTNETSVITRLGVHWVGNSGLDEGCRISPAVIEPDDDIRELLRNYFLGSFRSAEYYNLHHESDLARNEVYAAASEIFDDPDSFYPESVNLANYLYKQSVHPNIVAGEFYVVHFRGCMCEGKTTDALGLFKSENRETFLKVEPEGKSYDISSDEGININKLDKGCLIFNTEKEKGYIVAMIDNTGKAREAFKWRDDFLHLKPRNDEYHKTQNLLSMCKQFMVDELPSEFEFSKADQADMLNKSVKFFKENDTFVMDEFTGEVIREPEVIKAFNEYKNRFAAEREVDIADEFSISEDAVKKQQRVFRSVIKLDRNFHIYVHGNKDLIQRGFDKDTGMNYYKVFFTEES